MIGNWNKYAKDYAAVKPASNEGFETVPNGAYMCEIKGVTLKSGKSTQYIEMMLEITEGEYKDFFTKDYRSQKDDGNKRWRGTYNLFIPADDDEEWKHNQFLRAIKAIDISNNSTFDGNEATLKGKKICALMHKEEYVKNDGSKGEVQRFYKLITVQDFKEGRIGEIKDKLLKPGAVTAVPAPAAAPLPDVLKDFEDVTSDVISDPDALPF